MLKPFVSSANPSSKQPRRVVCPNQGKGFYRCPRNRTKDDCDYFRWINEEYDVLYDQTNVEQASSKEVVKSSLKEHDCDLKFMLKISIVLYFVIIAMFFLVYVL